MDRRTALAALAGSLGALTGCLSAPGTGGVASDGPDEADTGAGGLPARSTPSGSAPRRAVPLESDGIAEYGFPGTVCSAAIDPDIDIRAVVDPAFGTDWDGFDVETKYRFGNPPDDPLLTDDTVIGLVDEASGAARAYPLSVVWHHEIINDDIGGPVAVTYCPICRSGMVADRRVEGVERVFGVTGQLWRPPDVRAYAAEESGAVFGTSVLEPESRLRNSGNLVMYDVEGGNYWSQLLARAICGPLAGTSLAIRPSTVTTWGEWQAAHPETDVLLPPPASTTM